MGRVESTCKYVYPDNSTLLTLFEKHGSVKKVAEEIGATRGSLNSYLKRNPKLKDEIKQFLFSHRQSNVIIPNDEELLIFIEKFRTIRSTANFLGTSDTRLRRHIDQKIELREKVDFIRNSDYYNQGRIKKQKSDYNKVWRNLNKNRISKLDKEYKAKNKEKIAECDRQYRIKNKDKISERGKLYRLQNKERIREYNKQYNIKNKEKVALQSHIRRERERTNSVIDEDSVEFCKLLRKDPCSYCGKHPSENLGGISHIDHIEPLCKGGLSHWTNYTSSCIICNSEKGTKDLISYLLTIK